MTEPKQEQDPEQQDPEQQEQPKSVVTNILNTLNERASDKGWRFEQQTNATLISLDKINPSEGILVILTMDNDNKLSIDCKTFMEGINREMNTNTKDLVNSENRIYIKDRGRYLQIVYVETRKRSREKPVSNFVNCSEDKIKESKQECKLPEVIKELIWECIEPNPESIGNKTMSQLEKYYRPQKEIEKLVPEEREPPLCDFFKEIGPKINITTTPNVCGDKMIDYLKEKLADMREDINKISKTGKQKETADFEKSVEMELAGNEMWEIIKSTIDQPTETFDPNRFIKANINMPTTQADQDVEHKEQEEPTLQSDTAIAE